VTIVLVSRVAVRVRCLAEEQSLTLATGNGQTLFEPQAFRKSRRAQSDSDAETWVEDGQANTLNVFDTGDTRTTHAIVEPSGQRTKQERLQARGYKGLNHENVRDGQAVVRLWRAPPDPGRVRTAPVVP
jgi:hypothetical protein